MDGVFEEVKNRLGFGCMRFPLTDSRDIDMEQVKRMVDLFLERGFNYFDTAHGYLDQRSEGTLRTCLVSRHPRESYLLADKLSNGFFEKEEDILPLFERQLECTRWMAHHTGSMHRAMRSRSYRNSRSRAASDMSACRSTTAHRSSGRYSRRRAA